jgi:potassium-transporting ATPase KdpC subunit
MRENIYTEAVKQIRVAFMLLMLLTILTGLLYPAVVTGVAQLLFPWKANGSIIEHNNKPLGSMLIGQSFSDPKYFWGRASATDPFPYNAASSGGSNLGPSNPDLQTKVKDRIAMLHQADPSNTKPIPADLVTASASGLDPDISPFAATYQISRIAKARGLPEGTIHELIHQFTQARTWGILGEPRVNVLQLNLALDALNK